MGSLWFALAFLAISLPSTTAQIDEDTCAKMYMQCGGRGWKGPTHCCEGKCVREDQWYSLCKPANSPVAPVPGPSAPPPQSGPVEPPPPESPPPTNPPPPPMAPVSPHKVTVGCNPLDTKNAHLFPASSPMVGYVGGQYVTGWSWESPQWAAYDVLNVAFITDWTSEPSSCGGAELWAPLKGYPNLDTSACGWQGKAVCPSLANCNVTGKEWRQQGVEGMERWRDHGRRKVLVSIGGGAANAKFTSSEQGERLAEVIWEMYLGGVNPAFAKYRPFGTAVLDGVDLDLEQAAPASSPTAIGWGRFVQRLRQIMNEDPRKVYYIGAPPINPLFGAGWGAEQQFGVFKQVKPCVNGTGKDPIHGVSPTSVSTPMSVYGMLEHVDYVYPQFYNTPSENICSGNSATSCKIPSNHCYRYDFNAWATVISVMGKGHTRFVLGLPFCLRCASNGFVPPHILEPILKGLIKDFPTVKDTFGGFMGWELSGDPKATYAKEVAKVLGNLKAGGYISDRKFHPRRPGTNNTCPHHPHQEDFHPVY